MTDFSPDAATDHFVVDRPIVVTRHAAGSGGAAFPRLVVRVEDNAEVLESVAA